MLSESILQKLEWGVLTRRLAGYCQSSGACERLAARRPGLSRQEILQRWELSRPLTDLYTQGYRAPVGELQPVAPLVKAAGIGQMLAGDSLRGIFNLLDSVRKVYAFTRDFNSRCPVLEQFKNRLYPLPSLHQAIGRCIDEEGGVLDQASSELSRIRSQQRGLTRSIEQKLRQILRSPSWEPYLQDDFFTIRAERYVLPVRLDGRGRVSGHVIDTSDGGQTLYVEPAAIASVAQSLRDLELSEKLEVIRILRELSRLVSEAGEALISDYEGLVFLDELSAEAQLACELEAGPVRLVEEPVVALYQARHPLMPSGKGGQVVPNDIVLQKDQDVLIISGPNAGGKTVVLKTVGMLVLMAKAGLQVPADPESELYPFDRIFIEMGDAQSLSASLSTFSGHIQGLLPVVAGGRQGDLVLLDELAVGTEPQTGAAIAQAIVEELAERRCKTLVTTHYDSLKGLAVSQKGCRNASMEYSLASFCPTYRLILDVPGQSYGIELASQIGMPAALVQRAADLRGASISALEDAVSRLMQARDKARSAEEEALRAKKEAEASKARWDHEVMLLDRNRKKAVEGMKLRLAKDLSAFHAELDGWRAEVKKLRKGLIAGSSGAEGLGRRLPLPGRLGKSLVKKGEGLLRNNIPDQPEGKAPGHPGEAANGRHVNFSELKVGDQVWIYSLSRQGQIARLGATERDSITVEAGGLKLRTTPGDIRYLLPEASVRVSPGGSDSQKAVGKKSYEAKKPQFTVSGGPVLQTPTNTLDLRGYKIEEAVEKMWYFLDSGSMRGEPFLLIIHGHGTDALKSSLRRVLREESPYDISFEPGARSQGGDGVTVVRFRA